MKLSVSVPDELWAQVARDDDSPSQVVQHALYALAHSTRPQAPFGRAPDETVVLQMRDVIDEAVGRILDERRRARADGYRAGIDLANSELLDLDTLRFWAVRLTEEDLRDYINARLDVESIRERIWAIAMKMHYSFSAGEEGCGLSDEFVAGLVAAILDIWDQVEALSDIAEEDHL